VLLSSVLNSPSFFQLNFISGQSHEIHDFNILSMLIKSKYVSLALTSPINSRLIYPTAHSVSPIRCVIGTLSFIYPEQNFESFTQKHLIVVQSSRLN